MYSYIAKSVFDDHFGSSNEPCYIQNRVITNRVIKRLMCTLCRVDFHSVTSGSVRGGGARGQTLVHIEHQYSKGL